MTLSVVLFAVGCMSVVGGVALFSQRVALIVAGVLLLVLAVGSLPQRGKE